MANVLRCRPELEAKRRDIIKIHSIIRTEFSQERERLEGFQKSLKSNMTMENEKQRTKFNELKAKYDKEGVQVIENEDEIGKT